MCEGYYVNYFLRKCIKIKEFFMKIFLYIVISLLFTPIYCNYYPPLINYFGPKSGFSFPIQGQIFILECKAESIYGIKYSFLKNNQKCMVGARDNTLTITDLKNYNNGVYICIASNQYGNILSNEYNLTVRMLGQFFPHISQLRVTVGQKLLLDCPKFSNSNFYEIRWIYKNNFMGFDSPLQLSSDSVVQFSNGSLFFPILTANDFFAIEHGNGLQCVLEPTKEWIATSIKSIPITFTKSESSIIQIEEYAPHIVDSNHYDYHVMVNQNIILKCLVSSNPKSEISWFFNNSSLTLDSYIYEIHNSIMISKVSWKHNGTYICMARNRVGSVNITILLLVESPPLLKGVVEKNIFSRLGYSRTLSCPIAGIPDPIIDWYINALLLEKNSKLGLITNDYTFFIERVSMENEQYYQCIGRNAHGSLTFTFNISVKGEPPLILNNVQDLLIYRGYSSDFECMVDGAPPPSIEWYTKSRKKVPLHSSSNVHQSGSFLIFKNVADNDGGEYICVAKNEMGQISYSIKVVVLNKTTIVRHSEHAEFPDGSNFDLYCDVSCDKSLSLEIFWYFESNLILSTFNSNVVTEKRVADRAAYRLSFFQAKMSNSGTYTCKAQTLLKNGLKSFDSASISLRIKGIPKPSIIDVVESDNCSKLEVHFKENIHDNFFIIVQCSTLLDNIVYWFQCCSTDTLVCTFVDFPPSIIINSINSYYIFDNTTSELSSEKSIKSCRTKGIVPRYNPQVVTAVSNKEGELSIEFEQLPCFEMQVENSGYNLTFWPNDGSISLNSRVTYVYIIHICHHERRTYSIPSAKEYKSWNFIVTALNSYGSNIKNERIHTSIIGIGAPTCAPSDFQITQIDKFVFNLTWKANYCLLMDAFSGYKIELKYDNLTECIMTPKILDYVVNLKPNKFYEITLSVYSFGGGSGPLTYLNFRTPYDVPSNISCPNYVVYGNGVYLSWMDPLFNNGDILNYKIKLSLKYPFSVVYEKIIMKNYIYVDDLIPLSYYEFCVYGTNIVGIGAPSCVDFITSNNDDPHYPLTPTVKKCGYGCLLINIVLGSYGGLPQDILLNITAQTKNGIITGRINHFFNNGHEVYVRNLVPATYFITVSFRRNNQVTIPSPIVVYSINDVVSFNYSWKTGTILGATILILGLVVLIAYLVYKKKFHRRVYSVRLRERLNENSLKSTDYKPIKETLSQNYAPIPKSPHVDNKKRLNIFKDEDEYSEHSLIKGRDMLLSNNSTFVGLYGTKP